MRSLLGLLLLAAPSAAALLLASPKHLVGARSRPINLSLPPPDKFSACGKLLQKVKETPGEVQFAETVAAIEEDYEVLEVPFSVGPVESAAGQNMGSAKIFSLAKIGELSEQEAVALFGEIYRGVQATPEGTDHPNIRAFQSGGWGCVAFPEGLALASLECDLNNPQNCS